MKTLSETMTTLLLLTAFLLGLAVLRFTYPSSRSASSPEASILLSASPLARPPERITVLLAATPSVEVAPSDTVVEPVTSLSLNPTPMPSQFAALSLPITEQATVFVRDCVNSLPRTAEANAICASLKRNMLIEEGRQQELTAVIVVATAHVAQTHTAREPLPTPTPYILTQRDRVIERIPHTIPSPGEHVSLWRLGIVVGAHGEPYSIRLWSDVISYEGQQHSVIGLEYLAEPDQSVPRDTRYYRYRMWVTPQFLGAIEITAVSGQLGMVTFHAPDGTSGHFDLANEQWELGGQIVQATPMRSQE